MRQHSHDIDGKLHQGCAECASIERLKPGAIQDQMDAHARTMARKLVETNRKGKEQLEREGQGLT